MFNSSFTAPTFLHTANIYEVNIRQYSPEGSFNAFAAHLPRLQHMGVDILWLMPIHPIGVINRKGSLGSYYSIADHKAVNPEFGTVADFKNLIVTAHSMGMKVIIDWVANHAAWDHVWTNTHADFFLRDENGAFKNAFDWDDVIQIDHTNEAQQAAMLDAMQYWITEFDIDGFRADLAHLTPLAFWKHARTQLSPLKKDLIWLAETEEPSYHQAFDISYTWQWMHHMELFHKKEMSLQQCVATLQWYQQAFPSTATRLFFTSNHDENSWNGTEYEKYGMFAKALAVFSATYTGMPLLYSGQELPWNKRLQFFDKDCIEWQPINQLHTFYSILFALKKSHAVYQNIPHTNVVINQTLVAKNMLQYHLQYEQHAVVVFINFNEFEINETIDWPTLQGNYTNIFTNEVMYVAHQINVQLTAGNFLVFAT
ncbi:alpha-amylase family glycosyl hydrolase [Ferruginibacter yonginensis]|uniref:Alpha-amylase family glycosyl hydrolase n=1 Tax=Ferruginibacter yonginensis TaxID=1310416 RepID=A0ABV8QQX1_9BACT